jgi:hypothetical protein
MASRFGVSFMTFNVTIPEGLAIMGAYFVATSFLASSRFEEKIMIAASIPLDREVSSPPLSHQRFDVQNPPFHKPHQPFGAAIVSERFQDRRARLREQLYVSLRVVDRLFVNQV